MSRLQMLVYRSDRWRDKLSKCIRLHLHPPSSKHFCWSLILSENRYYMEEQALWEVWQDFGVVGTPATDSAGSICVYAHSTETRRDCRYA